jgi:hypothetical protein
MRLWSAWRAFIDGPASVLDIGGTLGLTRTREILARSDEEALEEDRRAVQEDYQRARKTKRP